MKVLWVFAHPDGERSLNAALRDVGLAELDMLGHDVEVTDLYAAGWKATLDRSDLGPIESQPVPIGRAAQRATESGTLSADIRAEQAKLSWAEALVLQFPLWWYAPPAILKGWIDRVFSKGFAYGIADPSHPGRTFRYGHGPLSGRRAQVVVTTGSPEAPMGPRGINGLLEQVLFPLLHGTLWYVGMDVLPPLAVHRADRVDDDGFAAVSGQLRRRLGQLATLPPLAYRAQNDGDYDDDLVLRDELAPGADGLGVHLRSR